MTRGHMSDLSVIVPLFNEEDNVVPLHEALAAVLSGLGMTSEVIYVDDGSVDRSFQRLRDVAAKDVSRSLTTGAAVT